MAQPCAEAGRCVSAQVLNSWHPLSPAAAGKATTAARRGLWWLIHSNPDFGFWPFGFGLQAARSTETSTSCVSSKLRPGPAGLDFVLGTSLLEYYSQVSSRCRAQLQCCFPAAEQRDIQTLPKQLRGRGTTRKIFLGADFCAARESNPLERAGVIATEIRSHVPVL